MVRINSEKKTKIEDSTALTQGSVDMLSMVKSKENMHSHALRVPANSKVNYR